MKKVWEEDTVSPDQSYLFCLAYQWQEVQQRNSPSVDTTDKSTVNKQQTTEMTNEENTAAAFTRWF